MSSNSNFTPNASLASIASKGPEINLGPEVLISTTSWSVNKKGRKTCQNNELSTVLVAESILSLARKDMCSHLCDVTKRDRGKLVGLSDRQRQDALLLNLGRVE